MQGPSDAERDAAAVLGFMSWRACEQLDSIRRHDDCVLKNLASGDWVVSSGDASESYSWAIAPGDWVLARYYDAGKKTYGHAWKWAQVAKLSRSTVIRDEHGARVGGGSTVHLRFDGYADEDEKLPVYDDSAVREGLRTVEQARRDAAAVKRVFDDMMWELRKLHLPGKKEHQNLELSKELQALRTHFRWDDTTWKCAQTVKQCRDDAEHKFERALINPAAKYYDDKERPRPVSLLCLKDISVLEAKKEVVLAKSTQGRVAASPPAADEATEQARLEAAPYKELFDNMMWELRKLQQMQVQLQAQRQQQPSPQPTTTTPTPHDDQPVESEAAMLKSVNVVLMIEQRKAEGSWEPPPPPPPQAPQKPAWSNDFDRTIQLAHKDEVEAMQGQLEWPDVVFRKANEIREVRNVVEHEYERALLAPHRASQPLHALRELLKSLLCQPGKVLSFPDGLAHDMDELTSRCADVLACSKAAVCGGSHLGSSAASTSTTISLKPLDRMIRAGRRSASTHASRRERSYSRRCRAGEVIEQAIAN
jgi:hypothetical protein